jgi:hypothetical protein
MLTRRQRGDGTPAGLLAGDRLVQRDGFGVCRPTL